MLWLEVTPTHPVSPQRGCVGPLATTGRELVPKAGLGIGGRKSGLEGAPTSGVQVVMVKRIEANAASLLDISWGQALKCPPTFDLNLVAGQQICGGEPTNVLRPGRSHRRSIVQGACRDRVPGPGAGAGPAALRAHQCGASSAAGYWRYCISRQVIAQTRSRRSIAVSASAGTMASTSASIISAMRASRAEP